MIILVLLLRDEGAVDLAGDADHAVRDGEHLLRILVLAVVPKVGVEVRQILAVEQLDRRGDGTRGPRAMQDGGRGGRNLITRRLVGRPTEPAYGQRRHDAIDLSRHDVPPLEVVSAADLPSTLPPRWRRCKPSATSVTAHSTPNASGASGSQLVTISASAKKTNPAA